MAEMLVTAKGAAPRSNRSAAPWASRHCGRTPRRASSHHAQYAPSRFAPGQQAMAARSSNPSSSKAMPAPANSHRSASCAALDMCIS